VQSCEIERLAELEDRHWWYAERRHLLRAALRGLAVDGTALDIGAAGGGNTRVLREAGWPAVAVEYGETGAAIAQERGLSVVRADAESLPFGDSVAGLVTALDVLEHLEDDHAAVSEMRRVLRPGSRLLIAVPADPRLWSAHDEAVGHVRRYTRAGLLEVIEGGGFVVDRVWSWNVLLRPVVALRRRSSAGSDLEEVPRVLNAALRAVVSAERALPLGRLPGVSLVLTARRP
jgi:SAM-dependent methyltransferase